MIIEFIKLRIREATRSFEWNKNVIISTILAFSVLYTMVCFLLLGFFLDRILIKSFPDTDPVALFNRVLLYYFGLELLVRFFMQSTPAMNITPFLHLPVKRSFLMHFLLARSVISPINYISFLIFVPFAVRAVSSIYSGAAACWWLLALFSLVLFVIYMNVYIKRQLVVKPIVSLGCGAAFVALIALDYFKLFSLSEISSSLFGAVLEKPLWTLVPVALAAGVYLLNYCFLLSHSYPEEIDRTSKKKQVAGQKFGFMSRFGLIGELIGLEMKLILRNKRTRLWSVYGFPIVLLFTPLFYLSFDKKVIGLIFISIYLVGHHMLSYGQRLFAWEGKFFDGILTREGSLFDYFRAKYYLMVLFCFVSYVLITPFGFMGNNILWILTVCFLFNIGVTSFVMLWFALYNRKRVKLDMGWGYQGNTASDFILILPLSLMPMIVTHYRGDTRVDVLVVLGIIGVLCHKWILRFIYRRFEQKKYWLAEGFRKNN